MHATFSVDRVARAVRTRFPSVSAEASVQKLTGVEAEACGTNAPASHGLLSPEVGAGVPVQNGLLRAVHAAYAEHHPLALSPDAIWLAVAQGFAAHVNVRAEELRHKFVKHEGQAVIEVVRDAFVKGDPGNDWPGVFSEFSSKIGEHIGEDKRALLVSDFSLTGPVERAASEVVLMDAMKNYFDYRVYTLCGIPEVTLLGSLEDWQGMRERIKALAEYGCEGWIGKLGAALDEFVRAYKGSPDPRFWGDLYKVHGGSGGPTVSGRINAFFPYVKDRKGSFTRPNPSIKEARCWGTELNDFPAGLSRVPFTWVYYEQELLMDFLGGFVGAAQDPETLEVRPVLGWGVADRAQAAVQADAPV